MRISGSVMVLDMGVGGSSPGYGKEHRRGPTKEQWAVDTTERKPCVTFKVVDLT